MTTAEAREAVIQTAAELGINVPKELAVLSVDNTEVTCENTRPKLSSIAMDYIGAGVMSAQLLAERLAEPTLHPCCRYSKDVFLQKLFRERFGVSMSDWRQQKNPDPTAEDQSAPESASHGTSASKPCKQIV